MLDELLVAIIFFIVLGICVFIYNNPMPTREGFANETVTDSAEDISGALPTDLSGCAGIPLSDFNTDIVMSYLSPDIAYAIMSYSIGSYNYLPTIQNAFKRANSTEQMAISALLGRYLAFNGGSAAIPGPGFTNTSPGNYVAQMKGATDLLKPEKTETASPVYKSYKAATDVAFCTNFNKRWTTTEDF
uniref:Uncharacterized protein n=1 Tax=viral metagenome TaxID=1070528 RepID=A0A6C0LNS4_9ZZZZ